jgi:hypothetical protein
MGHPNNVDRAETAKKKLNEIQMLTSAAPAAVKKYREKGHDASKLKKVELASVLVVVYSIEVNQKLLKKAFVDALNEKYQSDPKKLDDYRID